MLLRQITRHGADQFAETLRRHGVPLRRTALETLQINTGKLCNLTCAHCHVNAGPKRKEIMTRSTIDRILGWLARTGIPKVDITGGAPEMIPDFRYLIERIKSMDSPRQVIDRCNLTILIEPGYEDLPEFLARHRVEIIASLPCYSPQNVEEQRGGGVFDASIRALQVLNSLGYGIDPGLPLHLVYNPNGDYLPGPQAKLEAEYKEALRRQFGIVFHRLYTITNMPIARFASWLRNRGRYDDYLQLLADAFNPATIDGLMCRTTLNVGWRGEVYDCDFNQMLGMAWIASPARPLHLWDLDPDTATTHAIQTGSHCFGCTAGSGSSCGGALAIGNVS
jgi:radical SAM/Cys-rich protein